MAADGEAVDFEPEDDDLMDEDGDAAAAAPPLPKLKSAITGGASSSSGPKKTKGRGFRQETDAQRNSRLSGSDFDSLTTEGGPGPQRCQSTLQIPFNLFFSRFRFYNFLAMFRLGFGFGRFNPER